jgi:hypothetical protein
LLTVTLDSDIYTIELTSADRAKGATLNAFGFAGTAAPNRNYPDWYADVYFDDLTYTVLPEAVIPEPSTFIIWSLFGALVLSVGWWRRRRAV